MESADNIQILIANKKSDINTELLTFFKKNLELLNNNGLVFDWILVRKNEVEYYKEQYIDKFPCLVPHSEETNPKKFRFGVQSIIEYLEKRLDENARNFSAKSNKKNKYQDENEEGETAGADSGIDLQNYMMKVMDNDEEEPDEMAEFSNNIATKMATMHKSRGLAGQHSNTTSNPELHESLNKTLAETMGGRNRKTRDFVKQTPSNSSKPRRGNSAGSGKSLKTSRDDNISSDLMTPNMPSVVDTIKFGQKNKSSGAGAMDDDLLQKFWENQEETPLS